MHHYNIEKTGVNTIFYESSLSYLELVFQCAEFHFKSPFSFHYPIPHIITGSATLKAFSDNVSLILTQ